MIDRAKLEGLRQALERDGAVEFSTGAKVWIERRVVVRSAANHLVIYREKEIAKAYDLASRPFEPLREVVLPESYLDNLFGADPPF